MNKVKHKCSYHNTVYDDCALLYKGTVMTLMDGCVNIDKYTGTRFSVSLRKLFF